MLDEKIFFYVKRRKKNKKRSVLGALGWGIKRMFMSPLSHEHFRFRPATDRGRAILFFLLYTHNFHSKINFYFVKFMERAFFYIFEERQEKIGLNQ